MASLEAHSTRLADDRAAIVRSARRDDAASIAALLEAIYDDGAGVVGLPGENTFDVDTQIERIERVRACDTELMLVADVDGVVAGMLGFTAGDRARLRHQGEFFLGVAPKWRGHGLGRALLTALIEWAPAHGIERIGLTVLSDAAPALALYRSLGFREEGRRVREVKYGPGQYADQVQMALFLRA